MAQDFRPEEDVARAARREMTPPCGLALAGRHPRPDARKQFVVLIAVTTMREQQKTREQEQYHDPYGGHQRSIRRGDRRGLLSLWRNTRSEQRRVHETSLPERRAFRNSPHAVFA